MNSHAQNKRLEVFRTTVLELAAPGLSAVARKRLELQLLGLFLAEQRATTVQRDRKCKVQQTLRELATKKGPTMGERGFHR